MLCAPRELLTTLFAVCVCGIVSTLDAAETRKLVPSRSLSQFPQWTSSLAFAPDGKTLAVGLRDEVRLLDAATWEEKAKVAGKWGRVQSLTYSTNGKFLAIGGYQSLELWDVATATRHRALSGHRGSVTALAFSPTAEVLVSTSDDETARLWDLSTGQGTVLTGHHYPVNGAAWSKDGQRLATVAGDELRPTKSGEVILRDAAGAVIQTWTDHARAALSVTFSADGHRLISGGLDDRALVYDLAENKVTGFYGGHQRPVNAMRFLSHLDAVASVGGGRAVGGNTLRIWRTADGEELAVGDAHQAKVMCLAVSPDETLIATGGQDKTVGIWKLDALSSSPAATVSAVTAATEPVVADGSPAAAKPAETKPAETKVIRVGVIGLDTSHAPAFAKLMNDPNAKPEVAGCKVVAAYPKGSPDIVSSVTRVPAYIEEFKKLDIEIVDSIPALLEKVDAVLLETNDGRPHLEQVTPVLKAGKPCFIDKPIAGSLTDAVAIFELSKKYKTPIFSSSSLRYVPGALAVRDGKIGKVLGCDAYSPASLEATHPDLFWYGIHGVEMLYTAMGTGCQTATRAHTEGLDVVLGVWEGGRIGTVRGIRAGKSGYGGTAFGEKGIEPLGTYAGYQPLVVEIVKFFKTGQSPVDEAETLEIYAFMEAADESKRQGGIPIKLSDVMAKARAEAAKKLAE